LVPRYGAGKLFSVQGAIELRIIALWLALLAASGFSSGEAAAQESGKALLHQIATMWALKRGAYDGVTTFKDLRKHGDFGIGTVDGLDGEMVALDGHFYQVKTDGKAYRIDDAATTPFAMVVRFKVAKRGALDRPHDMKAFMAELDRMVPIEDRPVAFRVEGDFSALKVRSVPKQTKPYPDLATALKNQTVFELEHVKATLVGFRFPESMEGVNTAGYHFHCLTEDRTKGGHVLDFDAKNAQVDALPCSDFFLRLPSSPQ
jgi:acetolactate decarboxylase